MLPHASLHHWQAFREVTLPLSLPRLAAGSRF